MTETIAQFTDVSYLYPRSTEPVLSEINLEIKKGEFLGIIGPTGAGKTTFCLTLNGIVPQFYGGRFFGSITVAGLDTLDHPISTLAQRVGAVFEDPETQLITNSVENEIAFALENLRLPRDEIIARIAPALEAVRLEGMQDKHPHELSSGQKQRLAIAAALALQPDMLVLDEPTSQLDPVGTEEVFSIVQELNQELGVTVVMAGHAAEELAQFSDRLALFSHGKLARLGSPDRIYADVEGLRDHHLRPPQVSSTFHLIKKKGLPMECIPIRLEDGKQLLGQLASSIAEASRSYPAALPAAEKEGLLSVQNLKHVYPDGTEALKGVSLDIHAGEYVLLIGQNGAGKSTLVKHFLKLLEPTEGLVKIDGSSIIDLTVGDVVRRIGYIGQNPDNQIFNQTVEEEVAFTLKNLGFPQDRVASTTRHNLEVMGLADASAVHPLALPRGDRARVVIAAILAMEPEIIIFDEPTTGQDHRGAQHILEISHKLHKQGKTVIVITHHLYLMPRYAERVIIMGTGTILQDAPIRKAYHDSATLQSTFLRPPQAVLLAQEIERLKKTPFPLLTPDEVADVFVVN